jgi:hypothetical protein
MFSACPNTEFDNFKKVVASDEKPNTPKRTLEASKRGKNIKNENLRTGRK